MPAIQPESKGQTEFPNEAFVGAAIRNHFEEAGYQQVDAEDAGFAWLHPETHEKWVIEIKGMTASVRTDFNIGLGQVLCRMDGSACKYGLALPMTPQVIALC